MDDTGLPAQGNMGYGKKKDHGRCFVHLVNFRFFLWKGKETTMATKNQSILISGASIAGPTLAYWLKRYGFTPTVVERSPVLRTGGFPIDVRNEAVEIAKRIEIWPDLQQKSTTLEQLSFMDARNLCSSWQASDDSQFQG